MLSLPVSNIVHKVGYSNIHSAIIRLGRSVFDPLKTFAASFDPYDLFTVGTNGVWYDPSDINLTWRRNLLTYSEQFDNAAWDKTSFPVTVTADAITAPNGANTADLVVPTAASAAHGVRQIGLSVGTSTSFSVYAKSAGYDRVQLYLQNGGGFGHITFSLASGTVTNVVSGTVTVTGSITSAGNGWYLLSVAGTGATAVSTVGISPLDAGANGATLVPTYTGDGTSGIYIWGADLRVSNDALNQPTYQRVNTATDYDTVGFKPYLKFNGTNQWLQTNSIDFTYGDKMFVSAGVRKLSDAGSYPIAIELADRNIFRPGSFSIAAPAGAGTATYFWTNQGTLSSGDIVASGYSAPITNVLSATGNISGDQAILRVNGAQAAISTADQGTGNFGNYPLYIGARGGSSLWFNGRLYGMVVAGKQASAAEITSTETYINQKTGAF